MDAIGAVSSALELYRVRHCSRPAAGAAHREQESLLLLLIEIGLIEHAPRLLFKELMQRERAAGDPAALHVRSARLRAGAPALLGFLLLRLAHVRPTKLPEFGSRKPRTGDKGFEFGPHDRRGHAGKVGDLGKPRVRARNHVLAADQARKPHDPLRHQLGMLDNVGGMADRKRDMNHAIIKTKAFHQVPLMLMAGISEFNREGAGAYAQV